MNYEQLVKGVKYYNNHYQHWDVSYRKLRKKEIITGFISKF
jgi:hypothetical protein